MHHCVFNHGPLEHQLKSNEAGRMMNDSAGICMLKLKSW